MNCPAPDQESFTPQTAPPPGRIFAMGARALGVTRKPWFLLLTRDAILFLALVLAALALDNTQVIWRLWWPLPLALVSAVLTCICHRASPVRWRHLFLLAVFTIPLGVRAYLALESVLPAAGLRESQELAVILMLGVALWVAGSCHPARALGVWFAALLTGGLANWHVVERMTGDNPYRAFTLISLGWGVFCGLFLLVGAPFMDEHTGHPARRFTARYVMIDFFCLAALAVGLVAGLLLVERQLAGPLRSALAIHAGLAAQRGLWLQSLIFGWGDAILDRLIQVTAEPAKAVTPPWGGFTGLLARGGVAGVAVMIIWTLVLNRQIRRPAGSKFARALSLPAALAAFFMMGLMVAGGPQARLAALVLAGWLALALIKPVTRHLRQGKVIAPRLAPAILAFLFLAALAGALALPTWGISLVDSVKRYGVQRGPVWMRQRLYQAAGLNPFDPSIDLYMAESYRRASDGDAHDELLYVRVKRLYNEAQFLDPYETLIPLRLATFQLQYDRQEEAITTIKDALSRQPKSQDLMQWLFLVTLRLNENAEADRVLEQALAYHPMSSTWWRHHYILTRRLGQGPLANQALAVALTGAPEDPFLVKSAWGGASPDLSALAPLP